MIPASLVNEVFSGAFEKALGENEVLLALHKGMSVVDAFEKFDIM